METHAEAQTRDSSFDVNVIFKTHEPFELRHLTGVVHFNSSNNGTGALNGEVKSQMTGGRAYVDVEVRGEKQLNYLLDLFIHWSSLDQQVMCVQTWVLGTGT